MRIMALPMEDLLKLDREAEEAVAEAQNLKNWINWIINLKKSLSNQDDIILGGLNEQDADY